MSDDDRGEEWDANGGVTLPDGVDAAYNNKLSPFFITRSGWAELDNFYTNDWISGISSRGENGTYWSMTIGETWDNGPYLLTTSDVGSYPSGSYHRDSGRSLRCLVSTNNR